MNKTFLNKAELEAAFRNHEISFDEFTAYAAKLNRTPMKIEVGEKGWLKLKFDGFRFPVSMALPQVEELFSDEGVKQVRDFVAANKGKFKVKAE